MIVPVNGCFTAELPFSFTLFITCALPQGTVLDRVDYNVEHALVDIKAGKQEVEEAEEYQKSSRSCLCIAAIMLCVVLITVIAILQYNARH